MQQACLVQCFNCLSDYDAVEAIWCSCNPQHPTKVCPFCMGCFCAAGEEFKEAFWRDAPETLREETRTLAQSRMLIGEILVRAGVINTTQLLEALKIQKTDGRRLGEILVDTGWLPADRLEKFLHSQHTVAAVDLARARVDAMMLRRLGVDQCLVDRILPLEAEAFRDRHIMTLAMADPSNTACVERVMQITGYQVIPGVATGEAIEAAIRSIFPNGSASAPEEPVTTTNDETPEHAEAVRVLKAMLKRRASHLEIRRQNGEMKISYRIDGALYLDRSRSAGDAAAAMAACRQLAGLADAGPRIGRCEILIDNCDYHVIVRTGPDGESMTAKLINPVFFPSRIESLGLPDRLIERLRRTLECRNGLILVSSPPHSGATSTIYGVVMDVASQGRPMVLIESPRCISLNDVTQLEYSPEMAGSFEDAMGCAASSGSEVVILTSTEGATSHRILERLSSSMLMICHVEAMSIGGSLMKIAAMGYPIPALMDREIFVVHQQMLRRVCTECRALVSTAEPHAVDLGLTPTEASRIDMWRADGCESCAPTPGLRGRIPLTQFLEVTPEVARAVAARSAGAVKQACMEAGAGSLHDEALKALAAGLTTVSEVTRRKLD